MARWIRGLITTTLLGLSPFAASAQTLTETLTDAYRNSGLLEQNRALLRAADEDVATAMAALRPIVSWSARATASRAVVNVGQPGDPVVNTDLSATIDLSVSLLLHDFGASRFAIDQAKEAVLATRQSLVSVEQDVLSRAVRAHMEARRALEIRNLRQSNVRLIVRELRAAEDRFNVGEITRTDVSFAEARLASARAQLASADGVLARAKEEYRAVTGKLPSNLRSAQAVSPSRAKEAARDYAVRNHPAVLQLRHTVAARELGVKRAEAAMKPTTQLRGTASLNDDLLPSQQLSVTIGGPIYQGGALSSALRRAMAQRDASRAQLHVVADQISQQVGSAYAIYQVTGQSLNASTRQVRAAQAAFDGIREEAQLGSRTTLDVLDAEQTLLDARVGVISAQIDRVVASYDAKAAMGELTAEHLRLPVQLYDPAAYYRLVETGPTIRSEQGRALDRVLRKIGN